MKRQTKRLLSVIAAMIVVLTTILAPASVAAAEKVDTSKSGSASLVLELPGASDSVKLYQIAEYDSDSKIVMKKEAQDLKVTIDGKESEATLSQKAKTLAGKLKTVTATGKTDAKLSVKFDKLKLGYYLVVVDKCGSDSKKIEVAPVIVAVPAAEKSSWKYDVAVKLKGQEVKTTPVPATTTPKAPTSPAKDEMVGADDESTTDSSITPPSPTPTEEATPTPTEEATPTPTEEATPTPTEEATPTPTEEATPTPTETDTPSPTPTNSPIPTPTIRTVYLDVTVKWLTAEGAVLDSSQTGVSSLTIDIYRKRPDETSFAKFDSVELIPSNGWTHSWSTLEDGSTWTVNMPSVPAGYTNVDIVPKSSISDFVSFTITNKKIASGSPTEPTPTETLTSTPTEPLTPTPDTESDDSNPDFPPDDSSIPDFPPDDSTIPDLTVTPDPNMWQMSVTKYWIDKNNLPLPATDETIPDSLSIQIWKKASEEAKWQKVELVDLTAENKWTYSWMAPDDGATWTVTEDVTPIGFTQMTIKQSKNSVKKTLDFKVSNLSNADVTPAPVQLSIVKYWKDKSGNDLDDKEIKVESLPIQIYRKEKDTETWKLYKKVDLTADTAWEYHWGAADDGATWTVTERDIPEGYVLQTPIRLAHNAANTKMEFRVTNISNTGEDTPPTTPPTGTPLTDTPTQTPENITYSVVKEWQTSTGEFLSASKTGVSSLSVDIYQKKPGANGYAKVKTVELNSSNSWVYSWTAEDDGSSWTVTEPSEPAGYRKVGITQQKNTTAHTCRFTITNRKKAQAPTPTPATMSFSVVKKWQTASGGTLSNSQTGVSSLTVDIYRKYPGSTSYTKVDSIELLPSNNWTHSWTAPDDGSTWTVTEPNIPTGYTKVGITQTSNSTAHTRLFTITNKKTSSSTATPRPTSITRKVTATATPKVTGSSRTSPNTGDDQNIWIPIMTMLGASVVLVVLARKRVR